MCVNRDNTYYIIDASIDHYHDVDLFITKMKVPPSSIQEFDIKHSKEKRRVHLAGIEIDITLFTNFTPVSTLSYVYAGILTIGHADYPNNINPLMQGLYKCNT